MVQHRFDNVAGTAPMWREQEVFRKLHFTMEYKMKILGFITKCFRGNSSNPAMHSDPECKSNGQVKTHG